MDAGLSQRMCLLWATNELQMPQTIPWCLLARVKISHEFHLPRSSPKCQMFSLIQAIPSYHHRFQCVNSFRLYGWRLFVNWWPTNILKKMVSVLKWSTRKIQEFLIVFTHPMSVPWIKHDNSYKIYQNINPHSCKIGICKFLFSLWSLVN